LSSSSSLSSSSLVGLFFISTEGTEVNFVEGLSEEVKMKVLSNCCNDNKNNSNNKINS
jgi:hypothetical protein